MAENQQDQDINVTEAIDKTEHFINQNKKSLGIILGALVVAVGGYLFYQKVYVADKEKAAQEVLFKAENYFFTDSLKQAINGDGNTPGLEEIANDYSVSQSGNLAKYYLGMAYMKSKDYEKAIETLKSYDAKDEMTGALALGAIGDAYMETKKTDEAISFYEKASKEKANAFTSPIMMMKLAVAQESKGNYQAAKDVYTEIKKSYPNSNEGKAADKYIARADAMMNK
ncbi:MAG: tetratricopeptide repeat protein [Bacteroidetes bacterium]|nr:tetratricopeptide repeat protein [Bacteroidota bacterium]